MATSATWTVVFEDKMVIKHVGDAAEKEYVITNDDTFWNQSKFSNIWAIQYGTTPSSDEVEHRDGTPHCSYAEADLGDFQQFIDRWDSAHLNYLQEEWDHATIVTYNEDESVASTESVEDQTARMGPRPTSYSS